MAAITAELKLEIDQFRAALARAQALSRNLKGPSGAQFFSGVESAASRAAKAISAPFLAVGRGMAYAIGGQVVGALGQIPAQVKQMLGQAMSQQGLEISFEALGKEGGAGKRVFGALRDDALRTGVAIEDMAGNVRKLMAQGISESDALKISDSMLDLGGAVGMTSHEIGLLGAALSQVAAKGVANMEELRQQIAERGIPIFEALAEKRGQTVAELNKDIKLGKVDAGQVLDLFKNMEASFAKFKGGASRMAGTMAGGLGRIKQEWMDMLRMMGTELIPILQPGVEWLLDGIRSVKGQVQDALAVVKGMMKDMSGSDAFAMVGDFLMLGFKEAINYLWAGMKAGAAAYGAYMVEMTKLILAVLKSMTKADFWRGLWEALKAIFSGLGGLLNGILASMMEGIAGSLGDKWGKPFRAAAEFLSAGAAESAGIFEEGIKKAGESWKKLGLDEKIKGSKKMVEEAYKEGFKVEDVTGAGALREKLREPVGKMAALKHQAEIDRLSEGYTKERLESAARGRAQLEAEKMRKMAGASGGGLASMGQRSFFSKEVNALMGREGEEQVSLLRKIAKNTEPKREGTKPLAQRGLTFA